MIKLQVYDRNKIIWESKLEFISSNARIESRKDIENYIDNMKVPGYKKIAYKTRIWTVIDRCYPDHFYRFINK